MLFLAKDLTDYSPIKQKVRYPHKSHYWGLHLELMKFLDTLL